MRRHHCHLRSNRCSLRRCLCPSTLPGDLRGLHPNGNGRTGHDRAGHDSSHHRSDYNRAGALDNRSVTTPAHWGRQLPAELRLR